MGIEPKIRSKSMFSLNLDAHTGTLHTTVRGTCTRAEIEQYLLDLEDVLTFVRNKWGRVDHVIDARKVRLKSDVDYRCLSGASIELYGVEDRTAAVLPSERAIVHIGEMAAHFRTATFRTTGDAMEWLGGASARGGELELL
jgi:hypothetical protein